MLINLLILFVEGKINIRKFVNFFNKKLIISPEYMAPEMLLKVGHSYTVDYYCLGALLYELITGLPPYYSHDTD